MKSTKLKTKQEKGITLIALIITIVVLLILAAVALSSITNERILIYAQNVAKDYNQAEKNEQDVLQGYMNYLNAEGNTPETGRKLVEVASIGDFVNYDPTTGGNVDATNTTYTSVLGSTTVHGNGYTTLADGQTFSAAAYKNSGGKWRILNIEGETITLISDPIYRDNTDSSAMLSASAQNGLYLSNGLGYIWAEEELHRIASIYGHGDGADLTQTVTYYYGGPNDQDGSITAGTVEAQQGRKTTLSLDTPSGGRALTVEDLNKICGVEATYTENYSGSTLAKDSKNATYYPTLTGTSSTGQSATQSSTDYDGESYYYTYYSYRINNTNAQTMQKEMLIVGVEYWLGSRCVFTNSGNGYFGMYDVTGNGTLSCMASCYCKDDWYSRDLVEPVRAVVILQSGIQTSDETYNESTGWNLT